MFVFINAYPLKYEYVLGVSISKRNGMDALIFEQIRKCSF